MGKKDNFVEMEKLDIKNMPLDEYLKIPLLKKRERTIIWHECYNCGQEINFVCFADGTINCNKCGKHNRVENRKIY